MATQKKEYPGFPKFFRKEGVETARVANTPADAVNLKHRGYVESKVEAEAEQAPSDEPKGEPAGADAASAVSGHAQAPVVDAQSKLPNPIVPRRVRDNPQA